MQNPGGRQKSTPLSLDDDHSKGAMYIMHSWLTSHYYQHRGWIENFPLPFKKYFWRRDMWVGVP